MTTRDFCGGAGLREVLCDVDVGNQAARSLYRQAGFEVGDICERLQAGMGSAGQLGGQVGDRFDSPPFIWCR